MSNLRVFWIIWCCFWAAGWMFAGFVTLGIGWLMLPLSLLAILLPVGTARTPPPRQLMPPPCPNCGAPYFAHIPYGNAMVCPAAQLPPAHAGF